MIIRRLLERWADATHTATIARLEREAADLEAKVEAGNRAIVILEAERDAMAGVIARDRMRVASECAIHARSKAEAEGVTNDRIDESIRRLGA